MESQNKSTLKLRPHSGLTLMDQVREVLRDYHYAYRTEQSYSLWLPRHLRDIGGKTPPHRLWTTEVARVLAHLATEGQGSASTQRQTLNALIFLYRHVLDHPLAAEIAPARSQR